jgi:Asp-tRNA(Asn)/Glu-tRNA(Gln) amidotransferase A subunit family amidase
MLVDEALARIDRDDKAINAVVARRDDRARQDAKRIDDGVRSGDDPGPLAGVPVLVKDLEDVQGMPTTQGSKLFADARAATHHSTVPQRLTDAGAIIVGKTNLPEFACEGYTSNLVFGTTGNPWQIEYSPGGSSGGSAAAIAAGMVPIATATDGGGSIRIPAAFCGLAGIKPTHGVIGRWPTPDWIDMSTEGPIATSAADLTLLWQVMSGGVAGDPSSLPQPWLDQIRAPARVDQLFVIERFASDVPMPPDVASPFETAVRHMSAVLEMQPQHIDATVLTGGINPDEDWYTVATAEHVTRFGRAWVEKSLDQMHAGARGFMEWGLRVSVDEYLQARRRRYHLMRALDELLGEHGVLLSPTNGAAGWLADGQMSPDEEPGMLPPEAFNTPFTNITGHPTCSLPAGVTSIGVPFGLQVVGPRYRDGMLLHIARRWEDAHPWPRVAPGYTDWSIDRL